ncbi:DUF1015 domain-containing protein [Brucepastera parasyntrophica]|uniref:DUF1015 domain-containing protein n=1 Tax=Brucepastera parasyntrophica TaxID=2880008 RepID=UPI00210AFD77|nr:DUF1015 domain-containing protein [Brucepastera parasyntrophica]ULQ59370.1 DUF1015 domain-containing protein [Brucepastera parasyntrophica]
MDYSETLAELGIHVPDILIPENTHDLSRWAVVACDQYTQDRNYWKTAADYVGRAPSTLNIILPEIYLEDDDRESRLDSIRGKMKEYLGSAENTADTGIFAKPLHGFIYIERKTAYGRTRKGLVAAIDLEAYDWRPGSKALIRATEATIVDRIPPRMEIRRGAPVELPHIMLLINDPEKICIEEAGIQAKKHPPLYETPLMADAGSITGWEISGTQAFSRIADAFNRIAEKNTSDDGSCFLFAVGDGNHSLATAKAVWEEFKKENTAAPDIEKHPARFALVEIVNLFDEGLTFEPIHRVLFGTDSAEVSAFVQKKLGGTILPCGSEKELAELVNTDDSTRFGFVSGGKLSCLETPDSALAVSRLQPALDTFLEKNPKVKIDYIHGSEEVFRLGKEQNTTAILLPPVEKESFFMTIGKRGPLPRKSFSMGEASEKRFYLECRRLFG